MPRKSKIIGVSKPGSKILNEVPNEWKSTIKTGEVHCHECNGRQFIVEVTTSLLLHCAHCGAKSMASTVVFNLPSDSK